MSAPKRYRKKNIEGVTCLWFLNYFHNDIRRFTYLHHPTHKFIICEEHINLNAIRMNSYSVIFPKPGKDSQFTYWFTFNIINSYCLFRGSSHLSTLSYYQPIWTEPSFSAQLLKLYINLSSQAIFQLWLLKLSVNLNIWAIFQPWVIIALIKFNNESSFNCGLLAL